MTQEFGDAAYFLNTFLVPMRDVMDVVMPAFWNRILTTDPISEEEEDEIAREYGEVLHRNIAVKARMKCALARLGKADKILFEEAYGGILHGCWMKPATDPGHLCLLKNEK